MTLSKFSIQYTHYPNLLTLNTLEGVISAPYLHLQWDRRGQFCGRVLYLHLQWGRGRIMRMGVVPRPYVHLNWGQEGGEGF